MKYFIYLFFALSTFSRILSQEKSAEDFGFKHFSLIFQGDNVDILVQSRKGDELKSKPLILFCQGSLPQPLIKYDEQGLYNVFPFSSDSILLDYHIAIVSKPYIPLIANVKSLSENFSYRDSTGKFPRLYEERNMLDYYVQRNIAALRFLQKQTWVSKKKLIVAGHSEGSTIAAKMALLYPPITHLIYSGGNPLGRILTIITQRRASETDSTRYGEQEIHAWGAIIQANNKNLSLSDKTTLGFSHPPKDYLEKLHIPVLICYGTKDWSCPFNDYLRTDFLRRKKTNFTFQAFIGAEHNYFSVRQDGSVNYDVFNWDRVADQWLQWLKKY